MQNVHNYSTCLAENCRTENFTTENFTTENWRRRIVGIPIHIPFFEGEEEVNDEDDLQIKIKSIFQIIYYRLHDGRKNCPLHIMNALAIYGRCKSRELITSFNKQSCPVSYKTMKQHRADLAKYTIVKSSETGVPIPSHFSPSVFTIAAFDNFDYSDRSSLSGTKHTHDTAITLFQMKPTVKIAKAAKGSVELSTVKDLGKLPCQEVVDFYTNRRLTLQESFTVDPELYVSQKASTAHKEEEFLISCIQNDISGDILELPSWAGIKSLLSHSEVPVMHVGFLPFIPSPVTDPSTIYTAMLNFLKVLDQLQQEALPIFYGEGVFRIVVDIYLQRPEQFRRLIPMLGGFHTTKCEEHCIGKYFGGGGIDDILKQTKVFGTESIVNGTDYVRSLKAILILSHAFEKLKWQAFFEHHAFYMMCEI